MCVTGLFAKNQADVLRAGKGTTLAISNEDLDDIIRIIKPLVNSDALIDGVSEQ